MVSVRLEMLFYKIHQDRGEGSECTLPVTPWLRYKRKCTQAHTQDPYTPLFACDIDGLIH